MKTGRYSGRSSRLNASGPYGGRQNRVILQDPSLTGGGDRGSANRIYVGNLAYEVAWQDLKDHFRPCGTVIHADVLKGPDGRSKGCGIVEFADSRDAEDAIEEKNETEIMGRKIFVREDRESANPTRGGGSGGHGGGDISRRIYVGNLAYGVAWQDLKDHFKQCGTVVHADVLLGDDGRSKGCGIVEFSTAQEAQDAIYTLNDTMLQDRQCFVREDRVGESAGGARGGGGFRASRPPPRDISDGVRLHVGNLDWQVSWQDLKDHFRGLGLEGVVRTEVIEEPSGKSRGFGIVTLETAKDAGRALQIADNTTLNGRPIYVKMDRDQQR